LQNSRPYNKDCHPGTPGCWRRRSILVFVAKSCRCNIPRRPRNPARCGCRKHQTLDAIFLTGAEQPIIRARRGISMIAGVQVLAAISRRCRKARRPRTPAHSERRRRPRPHCVFLPSAIQTVIRTTRGVAVTAHIVSSSQYSSRCTIWRHPRRRDCCDVRTYRRFPAVFSPSHHKPLSGQLGHRGAHRSPDPHCNIPHRCSTSVVRAGRALRWSRNRRFYSQYSSPLQYMLSSGQAGLAVRTGVQILTAVFFAVQYKPSSGQVGALR
jgi:hypothetical protein